MPPFVRFYVRLQGIGSDEVCLSREHRRKHAVLDLRAKSVRAEARMFRRLCECEHFGLSDLHKSILADTIDYIAYIC